MRSRSTPDRKKDALALVVAGAVGVGLAEVAGSDRTVDGSDDLGKLDVVGISCEDIPAANAALGTHESGALQGQKDLLEVGLREHRAFGDFADRRGRRFAVEREREQCPGCIISTGRDAHEPDSTPERRCLGGVGR